jgi:hypothetical protein
MEQRTGPENGERQGRAGKTTREQTPGILESFIHFISRSQYIPAHDLSVDGGKCGRFRKREGVDTHPTPFPFRIIHLEYQFNVTSPNLSMVRAGFYFESGLYA